MGDTDWSDMLAAERMQVDQRFEDQVEASSFSRQQWGLVMTAVEFDIEQPDDPDEARLLADTSKLSSVMPQIEQMDDGGGMGMGSPGSQSRDSSGGLLSKLASAFSGGDSGSGKRKGEAQDLAEAYAGQLQECLEERGRWQAICEQAATA